MDDKTTCPRCGRDNSSIYKFCLGCGATLHDLADTITDELSRDHRADDSTTGKVSTMQEYLRSKKVFFPWTCPECDVDNASGAVRCQGCNRKRDELRAAAMARLAAAHKQEPNPVSADQEPDYALGPNLLEGEHGVIRTGIQMSLGRPVLMCLLKPGIRVARLREHARALSVLTHRAAVAVDVGTRAGNGDHYLAIDLSNDADGEVFKTILSVLWDKGVSREALDSIAAEYHRLTALPMPDDPFHERRDSSS